MIDCGTESRDAELRMVVVCGPGIDPASVAVPPGVEVRGYVPELHRELAACDVAVVQGGLTTTMELVAARRPFLYFPLAHHFEQQVHVPHRLGRYRAGRRMEYAAADPERIAEELVLGQQAEAGVMIGMLSQWGKPEANESGTAMAWMNEHGLAPVPVAAYGASLLLCALLSGAITVWAAWQADRYFDHTRMQATRRQLARLGIGELADFTPDADSPASTREDTEHRPPQDHDGKPPHSDVGVRVTPP